MGTLEHGADISSLLGDFFSQDDLRQLVLDTGEILGCPLLVLDDTFQVAAHYAPPGFSDEVFQNTLRRGEVSYEAGAVISRSPALSDGRADYIKLESSDYRRRFAPLVSADVRLGYLVCVDIDGALQNVSSEIWDMVEQVLAKQMFVEASRQDRPFETAEDILMHLLDGKFTSAAYFRLQTSGTYLADLQPKSFALADLTAFHALPAGQRDLRAELGSRFPGSHSFLYRGDIFMFLNESDSPAMFSALTEEFRLKVIIAEAPDDLFELPERYKTAREAMELMLDKRFHGGSVCTVEALRLPLLLKNLEGRKDLVSPGLRTLAAHDREKRTQYCETLYRYLTSGHSLKKTCDALFTHRNTILYRIRRIQEDFGIPLDDPTAHADILLGASMMLFELRGPDFFMPLTETE